MKMNIQPEHPQRKPECDRSKIKNSVFEIYFAGSTDVGLQRTVNEDAYLLAPRDELFVVADGMGGHAAGEVASRLTSDLIGAYFQETAGMDAADMPMPYFFSAEMRDEERRLVTAVKLSNAAVYEQGLANSEQNGMGSTVVAVHVVEDNIYWAHVGDSRLYRLRYGRMMQLTSDHSLLNHAIEQRGLKGDELQEFVSLFPYKNMLVRAIGVRSEVEVESGNSPMEDGDLFLLCTDGVHNLIDDSELAAILGEYQDDLQGGCDEIVFEANQRGGGDNITVVILEGRRIARDKALH